MQQTGLEASEKPVDTPENRLPRACAASWERRSRCRWPSAASCIPSRSCPSVGSSSAALRGWRRIEDSGRTVSASSTPACSSSIWPSRHCYSKDREQVLRREFSLRSKKTVKRMRGQTCVPLSEQLLELGERREITSHDRELHSTGFGRHPSSGAKAEWERRLRRCRSSEGVESRPRVLKLHRDQIGGRRTVAGFDRGKGFVQRMSRRSVADCR